LTVRDSDLKLVAFERAWEHCSQHQNLWKRM
jgi:hypothetical protein